MSRHRRRAADHDSRYRAFCEAVGWRFVSGSEELRRKTGDTWGIVHDTHDGIYDTWETCYDDWVSHPADPQWRRSILRAVNP